MSAPSEPTVDDPTGDHLIGLLVKYLENPENVEHVFGKEAAHNQAAINTVVEFISEEVALLIVDFTNTTNTTKEDDEIAIAWTNTEVKKLIAAYNVISTLGIHRFLEDVLEDPEALNRISSHSPEIADAITAILNTEISTPE